MMRTLIILAILLALCLWPAAASAVTASATPATGGKPILDTKPVLDREQASHYAGLVLKCVHREYPNYIQHDMSGERDVQPPHVLHPAFYGCLDWHSSVHGHWLLARLLRLYPDLPEADAIRRVLNADLTQDNIQSELRYFQDPERKSFERPYGWAWLLKLDEELYQWDDPDGRRCFAALQPLADKMITQYAAYFPKLTYPIRVGTHFNSALGLSFAYDYATHVKSSDPAIQSRLEGLRKLVVETASRYFARDENFPANIEPSGDDFLSSSLVEADLLRRTMSKSAFAIWFRRFLPKLGVGQPASLLDPVIVSDRSDPKIAHLDGLSLSRAWCMREIATALPRNSAARRVLARAARRHAASALENVGSGHYEGDHWLATFAVYMLSSPDPEQ